MYLEKKATALQAKINSQRTDASTLASLRALADPAFSRIAGAPLSGGNQVDLLRDAAENYPAWLQAISAAERYVYFESYIIHDDDIGGQFADALIAKAAEGVQVCLVYDWLGGLGKASRRFWNRLRAGGVAVRCYNPPRLSSPLGWVSRDHRKTLVIDGHTGFVTGLCVGRSWVGDSAKHIEPWRDTGIGVRGPAVAEIERAFTQIWSKLGEPLPNRESSPPLPTGEISMRIVASEPATAGMIRLDQMVAALARERLWLTDAYYAATTSYVQALRAAAKDGVDVRLLVPNATDIPALRIVSRTGYRVLLEAGVRVFEWNGSMIHAKTAVADGHWGRIGSTNLNVASWFGNCELDAVIEDDSFAAQMEEMYLRDLTYATEIVLDERRRVHAPGEPAHPFAPGGGRGSASRAAAGAVRIGNAIGAAFTDHRVLAAVEVRLTILIGTLLCGLALLFWFFPQILIYPAIVLLLWFGLALLYKGFGIRTQRKTDSQG
jgi:cardiolipin synthase A/B